MKKIFCDFCKEEMNLSGLDDYETYSRIERPIFKNHRIAIRVDVASHCTSSKATRSFEHICPTCATEAIKMLFQGKGGEE